MSDVSNEISPPASTKVYFEAAFVFARKIVVRKNVIKLTGKHRGKMARLDKGWLIIEEKWFPT